MRRLIAIAVPLIIVLALSLWRAQGPAPKPATAAAREFSAARAMATLRELLEENVPHPVATPANERVRNRIETRFRELGYETTTRTAFACNAAAACANVSNVIARPRGVRGPAVLLVAHHDSVGAGPGASDDGTGVAALLEIARAVRNERHWHPIAFLITDGEEQGLIGAELWTAAAGLPQSIDAAVVINVENRGTYGPSNMFETSRENRWLIRHVAGALEHPHATSLFYAIYDMLPNDTDVTVFRREGIPALNFAAIRGVQWYHTPLDDLDHVSSRTLQHHGENLLATARALADADLAARSNDDASYFDVLGFTMLWWPAGATVWMATVSLVLLVIGVRKTNPRAMTFGVLATFTSILLAILAGTGMSWLARLRSEGLNWVAYPLPSILAMVLTGIAAALCGTAIFRGRSNERALLYGAAMVWHAIAIALALTITGASYLFLVPAVALTVCALAKASETMTSGLASTAAAVVFFPIAILLYDTLGGRRMIAIAVVMAILATLVAPLFARFRTPAIAFALAIVCALMALFLPAATPERPRGISIAHVDDVAATPAWMAPVVTPEMRKAAAFVPADPALTPWNRSAPFAAPAAPAVPRVEVRAWREGGTVTIQVTSRRAANRLSLVVRGGTIRSVNGVAPPPRPARFREPSGHWRFAIAHGVETMTVQVAAPRALEIIASDMTYGLPNGSERLMRARDASRAVPNQEGDVTITRARLKLPE